MYKTYISDFFYILKINRIMPFCNLFMGRPSYIGIGRLLGANYRLTDNRPVPYWCISTRNTHTFLLLNNYALVRLHNTLASHVLWSLCGRGRTKWHEKHCVCPKTHTKMTLDTGQLPWTTKTSYDKYR